MERHPNRNEPARQAWPRPHGNPHGDQRGGSDRGSSRDRDEDHGPSATRDARGGEPRDRDERAHQAPRSRGSESERRPTEMYVFEADRHGERGGGGRGPSPERRGGFQGRGRDADRNFQRDAHRGHDADSDFQRDARGGRDPDRNFQRGARDTSGRAGDEGYRREYRTEYTGGSGGGDPGAGRGRAGERGDQLERRFAGERGDPFERRFTGEGAGPFDDRGYRDHDARDRDRLGDSGGSYRAGYGGDRDIHVGPRSASGDHGRGATEPAWRRDHPDEFHDHSDDDHDRYASEHRGDPRAPRSYLSDPHGYLSDREPRYHSDDATDHDRDPREHRDDHAGDSGPIARHRHGDLDEHRVHFDRERPGDASDRHHERSGSYGTDSLRDRGGHDAEDLRHLDDPRARGGYRGDDLSDRSQVVGTGNFGGRSAYGNPLGYGGGGTYDGGYEDSGLRDPAYARSATRGDRGDHRDARGDYRNARGIHRDARGDHGDPRGEHRDARGIHRDHDDRRHHRGAGRDDRGGRR